jgi:membrane protein implicated in regulation of membrane protease activity
VIITTFVGRAALVVGLLIGWPVLVALSAIFVLVQVMMLTARSVVQRNDRRMEERLEDKRRRRQG